MQNKFCRGAYCLIILALCISCTLAAESASRTLIVNNTHPTAADSNPATQDKPLKTISAAAELAQPGDTILVRAGIYRERVTPPRSGQSAKPIVYMAHEGEKVYIRGSNIFTGEWKEIKAGVYSAELKLAALEKFNPFQRTISIAGRDKSTTARPTSEDTLEETLGQVFINGRPYVQVMTEKNLMRTAGSWLIDASGTKLMVHFNSDESEPQKQLIEISVRDRIFSPYRRGLRNIHVKGFIMEHCANQGPFPQGGAFSIRSGSNWLIENNTIRYSKTVGLDIGSEYWDGKILAQTVPTAEKDQKLIIAKDNVIRNNIVSDNGLCGIAGWNHWGTLIVGNTVERNNSLGYPHKRGWEEWAGIKLHATNALIAGNLVRDNEAHGIWIDNNYKNARITRNVVINNLQSGIFLELGGGKPDCLVDNNIIGYTRSQGGFYNGNGIYTHDASDITIANNLFIANSGFGVCMRVVSGRKFGGKLTGVFDEKILNNMFVGNSIGGISLPADSTRSGNNESDYNVFITGWGSEGKADFYINKFQAPFDWKKLTAKLAAALDNNKVPENKRPNIKSWSAYPLLTIESWRALTGNDKHSVRSSEKEGKTKIKLRSRQPELAFSASSDMLSMRCPAVEDVDYDFYGNPYSKHRIYPGPFQRPVSEEVVLPLRNIIKNPQVRMTPEQKAKKRQERSIDEALKGVGKSGKNQKYSLNNAEKNIWFKVRQTKNKSQMNDDFSNFSAVEDTHLNARSVTGVAASPAQAILFKAPEDGLYSFDITAVLKKRTAHTAGYARVEAYLLDPASKTARLLERQHLNATGGYKSKVYGTSTSFTGKSAMKKGWYLVVRLQVISPGPAPAGYATIDLNKFEVVQN